MAEEITLRTGCGWVCQTEESGGPFVVGPFTDQAEANIWLENISAHLTEDLTVFGGTAIFYPESFSEAHMAIRRVVPDKVGALSLAPGAGRGGPLRPEDMDG